MDFQNELNRLQEMLNLRNLNQDPSVDLYDLKGSDEGDNEIVSLTLEPSDTLFMGDEESVVTSICDNLECDMPVNTPLPTTDVREEDFDMNSPLGEQVVDFLIENVDVAGLPKHLVKRLFSHLLKNPSLTKRMSDEPLGDDSKPRSYDVTFSNPLFDFNDDFTLCNDNSLFDEEFEDISSMDPHELTPVIDESTLLVTQPLPDIEKLERLLVDDPVPVPRVFDEPLSNYDSMPRSSKHSDLFEELIESSSLDLPLPDPKHICLREVERFDPFFSLTESGRTTRVMETSSFSSRHFPSPRHVAYLPTDVMYCYYHPHLTSSDGFDHGPKIK
nr:hypothetical protein [Tanacetum cinerariifolium]